MLTLWVLSVAGILFTNAFDVRNSSVFIPTHEWNEVQPGQAIPPGLHVRLNLQTGHTEARLMEARLNDTLEIADDRNKSGLVLLGYTEKDSVPEVESQPASLSRTYHELKKDFQKIRMDFKTDAEIIEKIILEIEQGNPTNERLVLLLEDLSYFLHQFDNARIFASSKRFPLLIQLLHHADYKVGKKALKAIGSAIQGNSEVKVAALRDGVLEQLHYVLKTALAEQNFSKAIEVLLGGVLTLGALLRDFPSAQKQFFVTLDFSPSGFELFAQLASLGLPKDQANARELRVRIITLLTDLYAERLSAENSFKENPTNTKKDFWNIYAGIPFEEGFLSSGFCETLRYSLLGDIQRGVKEEDTIVLINHDVREKIITACLTFANLCDWTSIESAEKEHILSQLRSLMREYEFRSKEEVIDGDSYFTDMLKKVQKLKGMLKHDSDLPRTDL
ncbi:unnamed protein product [Heterobilharzia americana]|nr:unnamed protein product [Heterobilharzia americana]